MSDAIPLPPRPNLEQYKKLAKDLLAACRSDDSGAVRGWATRWRRDALPLATRLGAERIGKLADAQFFIARAHGFESWPKFAANIMVINRLRLVAGADLNAESDAYGGRSMTLGLVATSMHPKEAGLQIPLLELLLERGAIIELQPGAAVRSCLANGCPEAAAFL